MDLIGKGIQAMIEEAMTPESFKIGEKFENYVRQHLFIEKYYDLLERTHDYHTNQKDYVQSSVKPDFKFRDRWSKKEFYVEVKFRSGLLHGKIEWCKDYQLKRYREYHKHTPVFLLLGMGDTPTQPDRIYLLPLDAAKYTGLFPSYAKQYMLPAKKPLPSKLLWQK